MLVILPPSETKADGGDGPPLDVAALSYPALTPGRRPLITAVRRLAKDVDASLAALKLGPKQRAEVERNRTLAVSPTMPALQRYTGVLFDPLRAAELTAEQWAFATAHIAVHSALLGLIGAGDLVPGYRLSHDSRVPGHPLKKHWRERNAAALAGHSGLILDLRSESYVALGPAPKRENVCYLRVVSEGEDGRRRALNHFNKKAKGEFVRALITSGAEHSTVSHLLEWASAAGFRLSHGAPGELELVV